MIPHIVGKHPHRYRSNPAEKVFAERWAALQNPPSHINSGAGTLAWLLHANDRGTAVTQAPTDEEHAIAATVIQWLGSPVGREWLKETIILADQADGYACRHCGSRGTDLGRTKGMKRE